MSDLQQKLTSELRNKASSAGFNVKLRDISFRDIDETNRLEVRLHYKGYIFNFQTYASALEDAPVRARFVDELVTDMLANL